jgi:hypothetical protein
LRDSEGVTEKQKEDSVGPVGRRDSREDIKPEGRAAGGREGKSNTILRDTVRHHAWLSV